MNDDIWQIIADNGIKIRQHYTDPALGWIASTRWGQRGPFPTREEALAAALRLLIGRVEATERREEQANEHKSAGRVFEFLSSLFSFLG